MNPVAAQPAAQEVAALVEEAVSTLLAAVAILETLMVAAAALPL